MLPQTQPSFDNDFATLLPDTPPGRFEESGLLVANQLCGVSPNDPAYFVVAPLILFSCMVASACTPALRAARVDPLTALRYE